ncbi:protein-L-isoaspartate O-methyltransferase [Kutzneria sp. 744]|uniref:protein-L-isoaspartate O-methyltransferase family protein n=1 Tax=Kutzneria sp. (strain 744) TaxID=345341 RepID=UPI0003EEA60B|nr:rRNA adenine N-6-methyltransferase family protein [Kutzneria sp. 744]EWM19141.1 protein-L-isoaspartate(D-aspartate) O-methyltransferase [Kutzneria sp. 744]
MHEGRTAEDLVRAVRSNGVSDERLLEAIRTTPRAEFVPAGHTAVANHDAPIPIGHNQVTTQPSLSAKMIEGLALTGSEHLLEIGTGFGFQTALLARLADDVVSVEWWLDLARRAERNLARVGIHNVELFVGDGSCGVPARAPYDAVVVSAAFPEVPAVLAAQVHAGGRLVQPIGPGGHAEVVLFQQTIEGPQRRTVLTLARFVRLRGTVQDHG